MLSPDGGASMIYKAHMHRALSFCLLADIDARRGTLILTAINFSSKIEPVVSKIERMVSIFELVYLCIAIHRRFATVRSAV